MYFSPFINVGQYPTDAHHWIPPRTENDIEITVKMCFVHCNQVILDKIKGFVEKQLGSTSQLIELNQENNLDNEEKSKNN